MVARVAELLGRQGFTNLGRNRQFLKGLAALLPTRSLHGVVGFNKVPELDVCFDIGRAPYFALTSNILCLTHGHMDHLAGLAYYLSQRHFQGMKPGTILLPREIERPVESVDMTFLNRTNIDRHCG